MLLLCAQTYACDICNMNVSLIPEDNKNIFSISNRIRLTQGEYNVFGKVQTYSRHTGQGANQTYHYGKKVKETFALLDIRGVYNFSKKWSLIGSLPVVNNIQVYDQEIMTDLTEIGDPMLIGMYQAFNSKVTSPNVKFSQRLSVGGGVKLPFGKSNVYYNDSLVDLDLQPGTGSVDALFTIDHLIRYKSIGLMQNMNMKINSFNKQGYRYGNSWNHSANLFYMQSVTTDINIMPYTGLYYEYANQDYIREQDISTVIIQSGGNVTFATVGLNVYVSKVRLDIQYQKAIQNSMNGSTQLPTINRVQFGLMVYLN